MISRLTKMSVETRNELLSVIDLILFSKDVFRHMISNYYRF